MDKLRFYTKLYYVLRDRRYIPSRLLSPLRYITRIMANKSLPRYFKQHPSVINGNSRPDIVVSLTSFPARINYVWLTVQTILRQKLTPRKVILWLSEEQFPNAETIPSSLRELEGEIFSIRIMPGDIRPHKKYYYAMQEYPDSIIVTVDDDIFYSPYMLEAMYKDHLAYPTSIIANETKQYYFEGDNIAPYLKWKRKVRPYTEKDLVQIGFGGVLYPPHSLHPDVFNQELFMKLAPAADDLWLNYMARRNNTKVIQSGFQTIQLPIVIKNNVELTTTNWSDSRNDKQLTALRQYFIEQDGLDCYKL